MNVSRRDDAVYSDPRLDETNMDAADYITKPFGLRELLSRVRAQLRRVYGDLYNDEANLLYAGDLTIHAAGQLVDADR